MSKRTNIINYMGGKYYLLNYIYKYLDYSKICFLDLFGGSGKVIYNIKDKYKIKIYNDLDNNVYNLFKQLKNNGDAFIKEINSLIYSEMLFKEMLAKYKNNDFKDDLERAVVYFYLKNVSFSSKMDTFGVSYCRKNELRKYLNKVKNIGNIIEGLRDIVFLNRDYKSVLTSIRDKQDIMLYADPPYYGKEFYYDTNFPKEEHITLANMLNNLKCSVMVSYYYFDGIEDLYPKDKWGYIYVKTVKHSYGITYISKSKHKPVSEELILVNYKPNINIKDITDRERLDMPLMDNNDNMDNNGSKKELTLFEVGV